MPAHVLQVITDRDRRGAQVFAADLAEAFVQRGRSVRTVALVRGRDRTSLNVPYLGDSPRSVRTLRVLRREIRRASVVVGHGSTTLAACAIASFGTGVPFVYRNIGDPIYWGNSPARRLRMRTFLKRPVRVVAVWPGAEAALTTEFGVPADRVTVIPKGTPAARFSPATQAQRRSARRFFGLEDGLPTAVYIGALSHEKNVDAAIEAIGKIPDATLIIVGDGPDRAELSSLAADRAPGRVIFAGTLDRPQFALAAGDALVLPSRTEGVPGVLIEAGFSGLPVVATDVGGVSDLVLDGRSGRVVQPGDEAAFAAALAEVFEYRRPLGEDVGRHLAAFEVGVIAERWDRLLVDLGAWGEAIPADRGERGDLRVAEAPSGSE
jgi:glycosyltransferase involved in cell wall biosynthesis